MTEKYTPVRTTPVEAFIHDEIQGISIPHVPPEILGENITQFSVFGSEQTSDTDHSLRLISDRHGRSYELVIGGNSSKAWTDEYGNLFSQVNTKGNNASVPEVCRSSNSPTGFIVHGMQESTSLTRVLVASDFLRQRGVETEMLVKVMEPAQIPYENTIYSITEYKSQLVKDVWNENPKNGDRCRGLVLYDKPTRDDIPKLSRAFAEMTFFITVRGVQVNERLADLELAETQGEKIQRLESAFFYVNALEHQKATADPTYEPHFFDITNPDDISRYCLDYLPKNLAKNLAGIHKHGLLHIFPHSGNISTVGSFYDLDSMRGEPLGLGDEKVRFSEIIQEVANTIDDNGGFPSPQESIRGIVDDPTNRFRHTLLSTYVEEMGWGDDIRYYHAVHGVWRGFYQLFDSNYGIEYRNTLREKWGMEEADLPLKQKVSVLGSMLKNGKVEGITYNKAALHARAWEQSQNIDMEAITHPYLAVDIDPTLSGQTFYVDEYVIDLLREYDEYLEYTYLADDSENSELLKYRYLQTYLKNAGAEENILKYLPEIQQAFSDFQGVPASFLPYYLGLLEKQTGIAFHISETEEEMIAGFLKEDENNFKQDLLVALEKAKTQEDPAIALLQEFRHGGGLRMYAWDHYSQFSDYMINKNDSELDQQYGDELRDIEQTYDRETAMSIKILFGFATFQTFQATNQEHEDRVESMSIDVITNVLEEHLTKQNMDPTFLQTLIQYYDVTPENFQKKFEVIQKTGWEDNIIYYLPELDELFDFYRGKGEEQYTNYYTELVKKQLGYQFDFNQTEENEMIEAFFDDIVHDVSRVIERVLGENVDNPANAVLSELVAQGYVQLEKEEDEEEELDLFNPLSQFIDEYVNRRIGEIYGDSLKQQIQDITQNEERYDQASVLVSIMLVDEVEKPFKEKFYASLKEPLTKRAELVIGKVLLDAGLIGNNQ